MISRFIKYLSVIFLVIPAIIFWVLFSYAGSDLSGFMSLTGFIIDGYRDAQIGAREVFLNGVALGSCILTVFLSVVALIISTINSGVAHAE